MSTQQAISGISTSRITWRDFHATLAMLVNETLECLGKTRAGADDRAWPVAGDLEALQLARPATTWHNKLTI